MMLDLLVVFAAIGVTLLFLAVVERMVSRPPRARETPRTPGALPNYPRRESYGDETRYPEDPPSEPVSLSALRAVAPESVAYANSARFGMLEPKPAWEAPRYQNPTPVPPGTRPEDVPVLAPRWPEPGAVPVLKEITYDGDTYPPSAPAAHSDPGYNSSPSFGGGESGGGGAGSSYDSGSSSYDSGSSSCDSGSSGGSYE